MYGSSSWYVARRNVAGAADCYLHLLLPTNLPSFLGILPLLFRSRDGLFLKVSTIPILVLIIGFRLHMCIELHLHVQGMLLGAMFDHTRNPTCCCTVWVVYPSRHYAVSAVVCSYVKGVWVM